MTPILWMIVGAALVLGAGIWLRIEQRRFIAELRAAGDPLADHPGTKPFRQRFQARLFGLDGGPGRGGRTLVTLVMTLLLGGIIAYSLLVSSVD